MPAAPLVRGNGLALRWRMYSSGRRIGAKEVCRSVGTASLRNKIFSYSCHMSDTNDFAGTLYLTVNVSFMKTIC